MAATCYMLPCSCGAHLTVSGAAAGAVLRCPSCGAALEAPALTKLQAYPPTTEAEDRFATLGAFQFSLADVMYCTAVASISCGYARLVNYFDAFLVGALALYAKYELASAAKSQRRQKLVVFGTGAIVLIYGLLRAHQQH
ncbi:MAG TPA: hypothetical protein VHC19_09165 [Pirellulales bacterium]|nr:hypothetical protein [Pirellulales bacterium]